MHIAELHLGIQNRFERECVPVIVETRVCDLTKEPEAQAVRFSVDGRIWEIDLGEVRPRVAARPAKVAGPRTSAAASTSLTKEERAACRAWAIKFPKKAEADVNPSGQLPAGVVDRWIMAGRPVLP